MINALPLAGAIEMLLSLALAWMGVLVLYIRPPFLTRYFPRPFYIIKAHIDYLLMALLLFVFFSLRVHQPGWLVVCALIGSITNPFMFIVLATRKTSDMPTTSPMGLFSLASFILTTIGFGGFSVRILLEYI